MASYQTVAGDTPWSDTKQLSVQYQSGSWYRETFKHSTSVPSPSERFSPETTNQSWKHPVSDNSSFKAIKKSGQVRMTDYSVGKRSKTYHVISLPRTSECYIKRGAYTVYNNKIYDKTDYLFNHTSRYTLQADYDYLTVMFPYVNHYPVESPNVELSKKVNDVMGQVVNELGSSYDIMTDVVEFKQSLDLVNSLLRSAINPVRTIAKLISKGSLRNVGDWWLQYRYGIMPIIYSIQDIVKTLEERNAVYRSVHKSAQLQIEPVIRESSTERCFFETLQYSVSIKGTGKERIGGSNLTRLHSRVRANPFNTAWELVPFSFVVDWFVNVSDWINAQSSSLSNIGTDRHYCYSVKVSSIKRTYFRDNHDDRRTLSTGPWIVPQGQVFGRSERTGGSDERKDYELITESEDSYNRRVFDPSQVTLQISPFLNWKRWADSVALTASQTRDLLRRK